MSNVMTELKSEITRLARKEIKGELTQVKKVNATQRGLIADLRRQVDAMQKELNGLKKAVPAPSKALVAKEPEGRFWITGKGVKALRKRLGLTQAGLAKLAGVSVPTVVNWEKAKGKINLRKAAAGALQALRGKGKREVAEMLGEGKTEKPVAKAKNTKGKPAAKAKKPGKIKRFDLLKDLTKPVEAKVEHKAPKAIKTPKKTKAPKAKKASKTAKTPKAAKKSKAPKAVEKVDEKPVVETVAEAKKD